MKINNASFKASLYKNQNQQKKSNVLDCNNIQNFSSTDNLSVLSSKYNDYLLSFGARVDKGLERFYEVNKDRIPLTVKQYIESLPDKSAVTPIEAQREAFELLEYADSIDEIKEAFPEESLFSNLINPQDSKAKRGILYAFKDNAELLKLSNQGILKNNENFTVYLVKKIFLEAKTIDEINKDLENDLNEDFKNDFKFKNKEKITDKDGTVSYVLGSTLKALGIQVPESEYQQSLRYTRDGYSDFVGGKITDSLRGFYDSLSDEERTARAIKTYQKLENWWESIPLNKKLDMLVDEVSADELFGVYKKENSAKIQKKSTEKNTENLEHPKDANASRKHVKIGPTKLGQDELFIKWATHNLKSFEESLSDYQKSILNLKRSQKMLQRWNEMTSAERTDYISKMKSSSEPMRYAMIDAWNNSFELIKELSVYLRENQVFRPADVLYSSEEFSEFQSRIMKNFWEMHSDMAVELGINIKKSQQKIADAISNGTFETLKKDIMREKNQRTKALDKLRFVRSEVKTTNDANQAQEKNYDYKVEFKKAYDSHVFGQLKSLPKNYYNDLYEAVLEFLPQEAVEAWTKNLRGEQITNEERKILDEFLANESPKIARINRALEGALATAIHHCTDNPDAFELSNSDVKIVMHHLEKGDPEAIIKSHKNDKYYRFVFKNHKINKDDINQTYEVFKRDPAKWGSDQIIEYYFDIKQDKVGDSLQDNAEQLKSTLKQKSEIEKQLRDYIEQYGQSINVIFTECSIPQGVKVGFYKKFKNNMPPELASKVVCSFDKPNRGFDFEQKLIGINKQRAQKYYFVPQEFLVGTYNREFSYAMRIGERNDLDGLLYIYKPRKSAMENSKMIIFPKKIMRFECKLQMLAMEQALADVLYDATGNKDVYYLTFEELCDNIEIFNLVNKFPSKHRTMKVTSPQISEITLQVNKKLNLNLIPKLLKKYLAELSDYLKDVAKGKDEISIENFVYCLNPNEKEPEIDEAVRQRIMDSAITLASTEKFVKRYYAS